MAVLAAVVWSTGACSTAAPRPKPAPSAVPASSAPPSPGDPALAGGPGRLVCFGPTPQEWAAGFATHTVVPGGGLMFVSGALAGDTTYGQYHLPSRSGIGALDLASGQLTKISSFRPGVSGLGGMAVEPPWLVWAQLNSETDLSDWSLHAWDQRTGATSVLATSRLADGTNVKGQEPLPVLRNGRVTWAQPVPAAAGTFEAELRTVDLATRQKTTLASGRISSPVYAGRYLIWGTVSGSNEYAFQAVDADTRQPVPLPAGLPHPDSIGYLAGSADAFAWSSLDGTRLTVWQLGSAHHDEFAIHDGIHFFQFLQLAGHFLVWFAAGTSAVLDLTTGAGFDVSGGSVAGSPAWIVRADPIGQPATKGALVPSRVSRIATGSAPPITGCR
ncbi:MAG: hypothetical protein AUI14_23530 [Actinobacteria bacterium 13_2_20CM_2_71_6]|nr:MAG: hypothetical protein AUI14_23530 [Actinobacteria bacterium 13_2_20CM_2_71_6]